jgi:hypothetical protein
MTNLLPQELREIIVGCTLGDLNIVRRGDRANARLRFAQSPIHSGYLLYLFSLFESFCFSPPRILQFMFLAQEKEILN